MKFERLSLPDVVLLTPRIINDERGRFMEAFRHDLFEANVGEYTFVQDNRSLSTRPGTIRGLHFQVAPFEQGKLITCVTGSIFDVAVDIRAGSKTHGKHVAVELDAESGSALWIPPGFAHGFCTRSQNTCVCYKVTEYYSPSHDRGIAFDDPDLAISWPIALNKAIVSSKDRQQPRFGELGIGTASRQQKLPGDG